MTVESSFHRGQWGCMTQSSQQLQQAHRRRCLARLQRTGDDVVDEPVAVRGLLHWGQRGHLQRFQDIVSRLIHTAQGGCDHLQVLRSTLCQSLHACCERRATTAASQAGAEARACCVHALLSDSALQA